MQQSKHSHSLQNKKKPKYRITANKAKSMLCVSPSTLHDWYKYEFNTNEMTLKYSTYRHFVLRFYRKKTKRKQLFAWPHTNWCFFNDFVLTWNQVLTWASVILSPRARAARSADAKYFCLWKRFSNSATWNTPKEMIWYSIHHSRIISSWRRTIYTHLNSCEWCSWFFSLWRSSILIRMSYSSGYWESCLKWIKFPNYLNVQTI